MIETILDQMRDKEFRKLMQMSLKYWKPRVASYENWREYKNAAVLRKNEIKAEEGASVRVVLRKNLYEQSKKLPPELREFFDKVLWASYHKFHQSDRPSRDRSEAAIRERYFARVAQIAELEAAVASPEAWNDYLVRRKATGCVWVCEVVCYLVVVTYFVYVCVTVAQEVPTPDGGTITVTMEICEPVLVDEGYEVCEVQCLEVCKKESER